MGFLNEIGPAIVGNLWLFRRLGFRGGRVHSDVCIREGSGVGVVKPHWNLGVNEMISAASVSRLGASSATGCASSRCHPGATAPVASPRRHEPWRAGADDLASSPKSAPVFPTTYPVSR